MKYSISQATNIIKRLLRRTLVLYILDELKYISRKERQGNKVRNAMLRHLSVFDRCDEENIKLIGFAA